MTRQISTVAVLVTLTLGLNSCSSEQQKTLEVGRRAVERPTGERQAAAIPHPILDQMEPTVASELQAHRAELDRILGRSDASNLERAQALGFLGKSYQVHRLVEAAEACYQEAHILAPQSFSWAYYLGVLAARRGDFEAAVTAFEHSLAINPSDVPAMIRLANIELDRGGIARAEALYQRVLTISPSFAAAEFGMGRVAAQKEDYQEAVDRFHNALDLQPRATVISYHLGQAYRSLKQLDLAESALAESGPAKVAMPDPLMSEINALAGGSSPFLVQGQSALRDGRLSAATKAFQRAIELDPDNPLGYQSLANVLIVVRDFEGAARNLEQASRLDPSNPQLMFDLATALAGQGEDERALKNLLAVTDLEPINQEARFELANTFARLGHSGDAERHYRLLLDADPGHLLARSRLATVLANSGKTEQAIVEMKRLVEEDPDNVQAQLNLGIALSKVGDTASAILHHQRAVELATDSAVLTYAAFNLGTLYLRSGDQSNALNQFVFVLGHDDTVVPAHLNVGNLLAGKGRIVEALPHFIRIRELEPTHPTAWLGHATALVQIGRTAEAITELNDTISMQPDNAAAKHALARLLSAAPNAALRDGSRALALMAAVLKKGARPSYLETQAMALAETGRFEDAARQQRALTAELSRRSGAVQLVQRLDRNLQRYAAGQPCCANPQHVLPLAAQSN